MYAEEGVDAPVAPPHLDGDEPSGEVAHPRAAVTLYGGPGDVEFGDLGDQLERKFGLLPILVYDRDDLPVGEGADLVANLTLLIRKHLLQKIVVCAQRSGDVGYQSSSF